MSEEEALVAAIEANPVDDTLRLAYADWLDEHDHPGGAYLRTELELAQLDHREEKAAALRTRLLDQRPNIDPDWLARFDQPHLMRANPTPFPAEWIGTSLPGCRDVGGTYGESGYQSLPPLPLDQLRGDWRWLLPADHQRRAGNDGTRIAGLAAALGLALPTGFVEFADDLAAQSLIRSNTDCYFDWPEAIAESPAGEGGFLIRFYADSQGCVFWYLYATPTGYSCVVASPNLYGGGAKEEEHGGVSFCAPSFEAFVYRTWIENEIWHRLVDPSFDFHDPRPMTLEMQAHLDYYHRTS